MIQHLQNSIDYLSYHLKMKTIEHLYYVPNVQIKDFNVLTDGSFFNKLIKNEEETYEKWEDILK